MENREFRLIYVVLGMILFIFLLPVLVRLRPLLFALLFLGLVGGGFYLIYNLWNNYKNQKAYKESTEGKLQIRIEEFQNYIEENQKEIAEIDKNIKELESEIADFKEATSNSFNRLQELIKGFQSEKDLRQTKAVFYQKCIDKLEKLLTDHRLKQTLKQKEEKLESLKDHHYEGLAKMENLKTDVEVDVLYLDTIEELSNRIQASISLDDAQRLKRELEEMTRELD